MGNVDKDFIVFVVFIGMAFLDFLSLRVLLPYMISSQSDLLVWGGFIFMSGIAIFNIIVIYVMRKLFWR